MKKADVAGMNDEMRVAGKLTRASVTEHLGLLLLEYLAEENNLTDLEMDATIDPGKIRRFMDGDESVDLGVEELGRLFYTMTGYPVIWLGRRRLEPQQVSHEPVV